MIVVRPRHRLYLVLLLAVLVRVGYVFQVRDLPFFSTPVGDEAAYHAAAQAIAGGDLRGGNRVFFQDPFYPYFLAGVYALFGDGVFAPKLIQLAGGILSCLLVFLIARAAFGLAAATLAGFLFAVYPLFPYFETQLLKSSLVVLLTLLAVFLLLRYARTRGKGPLLLAGVVLGAAVTAQGHSLFYVPFALAWLWTLEPGLRPARRLAVAGIFFAGIVSAVLPFTVRNYAVSGDFVPVSYQGGAAFYLSNNPRANGTYYPLRAGRELPPYEELDAVELAEQETGHKLKASEVSAFWFRKGLRWIVSDPAGYLALTARRIALYANRFEQSDVVDYYFLAERSFLLRLPFVHFGLVFPLAAAGIALALRERSRERLLLVLFALASLVSVVLFCVFARYRLQGLPFFIIFAAFAPVAVLQLARAGNRRWLVLTAVVLLPILYLSNRDSGIRKTGLGADLAGKLLTEQGRYADALEYLRQAAAVPGQDLMVRYNTLLNTARCRFGLRQYDQALAAYQAALELLQRGKETDFYPWEKYVIMNNVGLLHSLRGEYGPAREILEEVTRNDPGRLLAHVHLGNVYRQTGDYGRAVERFTYVVERDSANIAACCGLAEAWRDKGDAARAGRWYNRCLELDPENAALREELRLLRDRRRP